MRRADAGAALATLLVVLTADARAQLPPLTESFRASKTLRLEAVLGAYPWRHAAEITAVAFSADGALLATAGGDRRIKVWRASGEELRSFGPAKGRTNQVGFAPDGATLFATSSNGTIALWDAATGTQRQLLNHGAAVGLAAYTPDGRRLVSAGRDRTIKIWDPASGAALQTVSLAPPADGGPPLPGVAALAVSAQVAHVALADGGVVTVDLATGALGRPLPRALETEAAAFSADRKRSSAPPAASCTSSSSPAAGIGSPRPTSDRSPISPSPPTAGARWSAAATAGSPSGTSSAASCASIFRRTAPTSPASR